MGLFEHGCLAAEGIAGSVHPGIVVIAPDHPFIGFFTSRYSRNDIVNGLDVPVEFEFQMDRSFSRTDMVCEGQRSSPIFRSYRACKRTEQRFGIVIADRQYGDF